MRDALISILKSKRFENIAYIGALIVLAKAASIFMIFKLVFLTAVYGVVSVCTALMTRSTGGMLGQVNRLAAA